MRDVVAIAERVGCTLQWLITGEGRAPKGARALGRELEAARVRRRGTQCRGAAQAAGTWS